MGYTMLLDAEQMGAARARVPARPGSQASQVLVDIRSLGAPRSYLQLGAHSCEGRVEKAPQAMAVERSAFGAWKTPRSERAGRRRERRNTWGVNAKPPATLPSGTVNLPTGNCAKTGRYPLALRGYTQFGDLAPRDHRLRTKRSIVR